MLGQPISMTLPKVVGYKITGNQKYSLFNIHDMYFYFNSPLTPFQDDRFTSELLP